MGHTGPRALLVGAALSLTTALSLRSSAGVATRLAYSRSANASTCPDEQVLRNSVRDRLGYDPFFPWATSTVVVEIERRGTTLVGRARLIDEAGLVDGAREF